MNGDEVCHRQWDELESSKSSTWRELKAIEFGLESFLPVLKGSYIKWFSDSQTACRIISVGSMKSELHIIAQKGISEKADFLSRLIDIDDWEITIVSK